MLRDNIYIHPPSFLFLCLWECDISIEGRRPGHRTEYSAHVFNVKTSPAGSCSIFPQSTWAPCPKRWDFLCIQVTGWCIIIWRLWYLSLLRIVWICPCILWHGGSLREEKSVTGATFLLTPQVKSSPPPSLSSSPYVWNLSE